MVNRMEIYWKDLVTDKTKYSTEDIKSFKNKDVVEFKCQICNKPFSLRGEVFKRRFDSDGYFRRHVFACQSSECLHKKRSLVATSKEVCLGRIKAGQTQRELKKGKTFEELYGFEKSEIMKSKIRDARKAQTGTDHDPRLGKKHSDAAKIKMSESKIKLFNAEHKNYKSPLSGDYVDFRTFISHSVSLQQNAAKLDFYVTGSIENWKTKTEEYYDSSFELAYMEKLNSEQKFWHKNQKIFIHYLGLDGKRHVYIPDILLFKDSSFKDLECILEVKPKCFIEKFEIVRIKMEALSNFCLKRGIYCKFITEEDLDMDRVKEIQNENKKNK